MKIQLIIGSTRPGRVGDQVAHWLLAHLPKEDGIEYEIVDLKEINLPMFDEAAHPMMQQYAHDHTKAWSKVVKPASGFIFLTPEYNAGYPAALKNAIDYLYHEWIGKSVLVVSYGVGGGAGAGSQLRQVTERLKMRIADTSPALVIPNDIRDEQGQIKDIEANFEGNIAAVQTAGKELIDLVNSDPEAA